MEGHKLCRRLDGTLIFETGEVKGVEIVTGCVPDSHGSLRKSDRGEMGLKEKLRSRAWVSCGNQFGALYCFIWETNEVTQSAD